jgi:hypothetical protein
MKRKMKVVSRGVRYEQSSYLPLDVDLAVGLVSRSLEDLPLAHKDFDAVLLLLQQLTAAGIFADELHGLGIGFKS